MKLSFKPDERSWLHSTINKLLLVANHHPEGQEMSRLACRMRYKFQGVAPFVHLNGKERRLIADIAAHRFQALQNQISEEKITVRHIMEVLNAARAD